MGADSSTGMIAGSDGQPTGTENGMKKEEEKTMLIYLLIDSDKEKKKRLSLMFTDGDMWVAFRGKFLDGDDITPENVSRMVRYNVEHPMTSDVFRTMYIGCMNHAIRKDSPVLCGIGWDVAAFPDEVDDENDFSDRVRYVRDLIRKHDDDMIIYSYIDSLETDYPWCMSSDVIKWWCDTTPLNA